MAHWRERDRNPWVRAFTYEPSQPVLSDWTVFWLTVGLAVAIAAVGWMTS